MKRLIMLVALVLLGWFGYSQTIKPSCLKLESRDKLDCVRQNLDRFLDQKKVGPALAFLQQYRLQDSQFSDTDCHGLAHYIGDKAYGFYIKNQALDFDENANLCGYGFYHAFITSFVLEDKAEAAKAFCQNMENKSEAAAYSCYHGLGHGSIHLFEEDFLISDSAMILSEGVKLCERVLTGAGDKFDECLAGVYDGIGDIVLGSGFIDEDISAEELYGLCLIQPQAYQAICLDNMSHLVYRKTGRSFSDLAQLVINHEGIKAKAAAIRGLAIIFVVDNINRDLSEGVAVCQSLHDDLKSVCISNMAFKVFNDAPLEQHRQTAEKFCLTSGFNDAEKAICVKGYESLCPGGCQ